MSTASLSAEPEKSRLLSQKQMTFSSVWDFHLYGIFTCMGFSPVWDFHLYGIFTCMGFSPVWDFHLYGIFTCMAFSSVWLFHLYEVFCVWGFLAYVDFAYGFCPWVFICGFFILAEYAGGVCGRSMRAEYADEAFLTRRSSYELSFAMRR